MGRYRRMITQVVLLVATVAALAAVPTGASAGYYCYPFEAGDHGTCAGPYQALSSNSVIAQTSTWATCAGAQTSSGAFYGQYFCANDYSCHAYGGGNLTPLAHNHESFGQEIWGGTNSDFGQPCPHGGPVSLTAGDGGTADAAFDSGDYRCLRVADGSTGFGVACTSKAEAARGALVGTLRPGADGNGAELDGPITVVALAPAGAQYATLQQRDASARRVAVTDGLVRTVVDDDSATLRWDTAPVAAAAITVP